MHPSELVVHLRTLQSAGMSDADLTRLHHFSLKRHKVYFSNAIRYFEAKKAIRQTNELFAARCAYIAEKINSGRVGLQTLIDEALERNPLS